MSEVISLINLKGGVGKTVSSINIAYSFAEFNKKVLIVDADSQGNIATSLGMIADELDNTLCDLIDEAIADGVTEQRVVECIRQVGKVDIIPANSVLAEMDYKVMNAYRREYLLKDIISTIEHLYDYIIIDCPPSLSLIVTNALTASNYVLIPVETQYLSFESLRVMLDTISMIQKKLNKELQIKGIFLTKYQSRTKLSQGIREKVYEIYGKDIKVFEEYIPYSIKAAEQTLYGKSLIELAPDNPVSVAYMNITKELLADEE